MLKRLTCGAVLPLVVLAIGAASAGWEFERVDSVGARVEVQARRLPDGRLCLCYGNPPTGVRYAVKDSVWHFEDIPGASEFGFSVSPAGIPAVLRGSEYVERTDSGWVAETVPGTPDYPYLAHDSTGSPVYLRFASAPDTQMLIAVSRVDSVWQQDTAVLLTMPSEGLGAGGLRQDALGRPIVLFGYYEIYGALSYEYLNVAIRTDSGWRREGAGSTMDGYIPRSALGVDESGGWGVASVVTGYLIDYWLCYAGVGGGGGIVRAQGWTSLAVTIDELERPQIVYLQDEHPLLAWKDSTGWDTLRVPWNDWVGAFDIVTSDRNEPVIAMSTRSGVWLANADRVLGCNEETGRAPGPSHRTGIFCRGSLNLNAALCSPVSDADLLDASGRKVLTLSSGPNDLSRLAAGVYHLRARGGAPRGRVVVVR